MRIYCTNGSGNIAAVMKLKRGKRNVVIQPKTEEPAFIPFIEMKRQERLSSLGLCAEFPNGIKLEFSGLGNM